MKKQENNYAFIDSQNLYLSLLKRENFKLDYKRFRIYLKEKYGVKTAYMFMGFLSSNKELYRFLQVCGFIIIFKPILEIEGEPVKGNCDADLVLRAMIDFKEYDKAIIITGDGDFYSLVQYLDEQNKLLRVLAPSRENCSSLLRMVSGRKLVYVTDLKNKLEYKKKEPHKDETL